MPAKKKGLEKNDKNIPDEPSNQQDNALSDDEDDWSDMISSDQVSGTPFDGLDSAEVEDLPKGTVEDEAEMSVSLSTYYEPTLAIGDMIEIAFDTNPTAKNKLRGKVLEFYEDRKVPGIGGKIKGTPADPAVKIQLYKEKNGKWMPTKEIKGYKMSELKRKIGSYKEE